MIETETLILTEDWEITLFPDAISIWSPQPDVLNTVYLKWRDLAKAIIENGSILEEDVSRPLSVGSYSYAGEQWEVLLPLCEQDDIIAEMDGEIRSISILDLLQLCGDAEEEESE